MSGGLWKLPRLTVLWKGCRFAWKSAGALFHSPPTGPWKSLRRQVASAIPTAAWKTRTGSATRRGSAGAATLMLSFSSSRPSAFPTAPTGPAATGSIEKSKNLGAFGSRNPTHECQPCARSKVSTMCPAVRGVRAPQQPRWCQSERISLECSDEPPVAAAGRDHR